MSMKTMMPWGLNERLTRDPAGLAKSTPSTRRQPRLPTRSFCVPRSRAPHPISPAPDVKINDGSKLGNAMGLAVLLSSVLAPATVVAATRPLLEVAAHPEMHKAVSSVFAIPTITIGVVSMAKVVETLTEAQRRLQKATRQRKAQQRHEAHLAEHPEEAHDLVSDAMQSASASAAHQLEAEQTHAAASSAEGGRARWVAVAGASHAAGQGAAQAVTEANAQQSAEHAPTAVADSAEQSPSLAAQAAARERELAAAAPEVVVEEAVTEQALVGATEVAHVASQLEQRSRLPVALREVQSPLLQPRPASPSHDSVSQAAAAVIAAPTAGAPAGAVQGDAAGAEAAAAAREALQAELAEQEAEYTAKISQLREHVRQEQAARPRSKTPTRSATEAHQMAEEYEAKLAQVRQESAAKLAAQAQEAAQREERVAALQARRQRPQSPPSPAVSTPPPADKAPSFWKRAQALIMSIWAWLVSMFGGSNKPRMA